MNEFNSPPAGKPAGEFLRGQPNFPQRIFVAEAEADLRQLGAEVLMDAGYQVDAAEDGNTAWAALLLHRYDLLITGQYLPQLSGVELVKKLYTARMKLPVIMAIRTLPIWQFALHPCLQAVKMLHKPYNMHKLLDLVESVLPARNHPHGISTVAASQSRSASAGCG